MIGGWFAELHRSHGVTFRFGEGVERLEPGNDPAHVGAVVTSAGTRLAADAVVVGVGITPNTALAEAGGLEVDNGVVTDAQLRTSADGVWAAGDVANWQSTTLGTHVRVEHWANANDGGLAAGRSMAGADVTYDPIRSSSPTSTTSGSSMPATSPAAPAPRSCCAVSRRATSSWPSGWCPRGRASGSSRACTSTCGTRSSTCSSSCASAPSWIARGSLTGIDLDDVARRPA